MTNRSLLLRAIGVAGGLAACAHAPAAPRGGSATSPEAAVRRPAPYRRVPRGSLWFVAGAGCTNGPLTLSFTLPPARWGTQVEFRAVSARALAAHFRIPAPSNLWRVAHPELPDERCVARPGERGVDVGPAASSGATTATTGRAAPSHPGKSAAAPRALTALVGEPPHPPGTSDHSLGGAWFTTHPEIREMPELDGDGCWRSEEPYPVTPIELRIWFQSVQDLAGVLFEVRFVEVVPEVSDEAFAKLLRDRLERDRATAAARAPLCAREPSRHECYIGCAKSGGVTLVTTGALDPPPAGLVEKRPVAPHRQAEWIAGSWRWIDGDRLAARAEARGRWAWDGGFWRLAATSPTVPPPRPPAPSVAALGSPRVGSSPPSPSPAPLPLPLPPARPSAPSIPSASPSPGMQWQPDRWSWTGSGWRWSAGHWIVPRRFWRWLPPEAGVGPRGLIVLPGRWLLE